MRSRTCFRSLWLVAMLLSGAALAETPNALKLALPGFSYINLDEKTGDFYLDYFSQQLQQQSGISVVTKHDVAAILGIERQREYTACAEGLKDCTVELAGALGVDGVITGSLANLDGMYVINLKVIAARDARSLGVFSTRVKTSAELLEYLQSSAQKFAATAPRPEVVRRLKPFGMLWRSVLAAGAVSVAAGGGFFALAKNTESELRAPPTAVTTQAQLLGIQRRGEQQQLAAWIAGGVGLAALGIGAILWTQDLPPKLARAAPRVGAAPIPGGGLVLFTAEGGL